MEFLTPAWVSTGHVTHDTDAHWHNSGRRDATGFSLYLPFSAQNCRSKPEKPRFTAAIFRTSQSLGVVRPQIPSVHHSAVPALSAPGAGHQIRYGAYHPHDQAGKLLVLQITCFSIER